MTLWQFSFLGGTHVAHGDSSHVPWKYKLVQHSSHSQLPPSSGSFLSFYISWAGVRPQSIVLVVSLVVSQVTVFGIVQLQKSTLQSILVDCFVIFSRWIVRGTTSLSLNRESSGELQSITPLSKEIAQPTYLKTLFSSSFVSLILLRGPSTFSL